MIVQIARKDWRLLWPLVALLTMIQAALEWTLHELGLSGEDPAAGVLLHPLTMAWFVGIAALTVAVVQQDPIPGVDQDWLIRPLRRTHLLIAKFCFVAVTVCVPMLALNLVDALVTGFGFWPSLEAAVLKELFLLGVLVVPLMALAATTRNLSEIVLFGAVLMVVFAAALGASAFFLGPEWCPTCGSGVSWLQHLLQHAGVLVGACVVLAIQYYRRRTVLARTLCLIGGLLLVLVQLPWNVAFSLQRRITGTLVSPAAIRLEIEPAPVAGLDPGASTARGSAPRDVNEAVQYVRRRVGAEDGAVAIEVPLGIEGLPAGDVLLADRAHIELQSSVHQILYRGSNAGVPPLLLRSPGALDRRSDIAIQPLDIPERAFRAGHEGVDVRLDYSLTLMHEVGEFSLAGRLGGLRAPQIGRCATTNDRNGVYLRCKSIERAPFCFSATLVGEGGRRNPLVLTCKPDYRRGVPSVRDVLDLYGADLPVRDRIGTIYPLGAADVATSHVELIIYAEGAHFRRVLEASGVALAAWRAPSG